MQPTSERRLRQRFSVRVHAKAQLRILGARAPKRRARFPKALYGLPAFEIVLA
jgi:hypothetical protein